uniref:Uncharacterized protein n=1 Tax=Strigamia maritima TaxID=126957 RepID=T1IQK3_STRMM
MSRKVVVDQKKGAKRGMLLRKNFDASGTRDNLEAIDHCNCTNVYLIEKFAEKSVQILDCHGLESSLDIPLIPGIKGNLGHFVAVCLRSTDIQILDILSVSAEFVLIRNTNVRGDSDSPEFVLIRAVKIEIRAATEKKLSADECLKMQHLIANNFLPVPARILIFTDEIARIQGYQKIYILIPLKKIRITNLWHRRLRHESPNHLKNPPKPPIPAAPAAPMVPKPKLWTPQMVKSAKVAASNGLSCIWKET